MHANYCNDVIVMAEGSRRVLEKIAIKAHPPFLIGCNSVPPPIEYLCQILCRLVKQHAAGCAV